LKGADKQTDKNASSATVKDDDVAKQIKLAADGATVEERQRAFDRLEAWGYVDKVPWLAKLTKDLAQLPTCEERRDVVTQLRKLNDPKAIQPLKDAAGRPDNGCLKQQAETAIVALGGSPPAPAQSPPSQSPPQQSPPPRKSSGGGHF
jgi:hypothetical protein